ncbi:MAG: Lrp/AsnC family transcriptional regulator [Nocardioides sp.]
MNPVHLQDSFTLDEVDLALVNAVQLQPRAPWTAIGRVLGVDPVTASRRWDRLAEVGAAWVTCFPLLTPRSVAAVVELDCEPGRTLDVAAAVSADPEVLFVNIAAGSRDLLLTVAGADTPRLAEYVLRHVGATPGVARVKTHQVVSVHSEGGTWTVGALDRQAREALATPTRPFEMSSHLPDDDDWALCDLLAADGRAKASTLAQAVGISEPTARRKLDRLSRTGSLRFQVGIAEPISSWPVTAWLFAQLPANQVDVVARGLSTFPPLRSAASVAGPSNLILQFSLRALDHVHRLEADLEERIPNLVITDRAVNLGVAKQLGRLINERGFATNSTSLRPRQSYHYNP